MNLVFSATTSEVDWNDSFWNDSRAGSFSWLVYQVGGATTGFNNINLASNFEDLNAVSLETVRAGASFGVTQIDNDIYLTYTVPEPSTYALLGLAGAGLAVYVLRRRRR